jgi:isoquinoline 1-oxidoreductase beta subunit
MSADFVLGRRQFLQGAAAVAGGLVLGFYLPPPGRAEAEEPPPGGFAPNVFVRIMPDESVTVTVPKSEMGQGVYTALPMCLADELDVDFAKVHVESAPVAPVFNGPMGMQLTGGSSSTRTEWQRFRQMGALARAVLVAAAAHEWSVDPSTCHTQKGVVTDAKKKRKLTYGQLATKAALLPVPKDAPLKADKDLTYIGKPQKRLDTPDKTTGRAQFGLDVQLPGMLTAVVARAPVFGAKVTRFDGAAAKAQKGVKAVLPISSGVAVVADGFWPAKLGRDLLRVEWDEGPGAQLSTAAQLKSYIDKSKQPGLPARKDGDVHAALAGATKQVEALYELPYLAHAAMEPLNCVADVRAGSCEVWTGTQAQTMDFAWIAKTAGVPPAQVKLHTTFLGGGFGRRGVVDGHFVREAVELSKALHTPVRVVWTREDDMAGGHYRPLYVHRVAGGVGADGKPVAWAHTIVGQSIMTGTPMEKMMLKAGVDSTSVEGARDLPYAIAAVQVTLHSTHEVVPVHWWRSVGHSHTAFVTETFMDELAHLTGQDPFEYRRGLLKDKPAHKATLELVADKAGWSKPLAAGHHRGIAVHESFGSIAAHVVEISIVPPGKLKIHRVVAAVNCGPTVNPDTIKAQLEGGVVFALSAALYGEITFDKGRVQQKNFHTYRMLRMHEMPLCEAYIVPSQDPNKMGGIGEPGVPPVAPALANAIFSATGKRIRRLPIRPEDLKQA